jgi:predicted acyl esterase
MKVGNPEEVRSASINVEAPMRDGTILRADVYRPASPGSYPVLIQRTPYDKTGSLNVLHRDARAPTWYSRSSPAEPSERMTAGPARAHLAQGSTHWRLEI